MIAKFARYLVYLQFLTCENETYAKIQDLQIAPRFLGHITENNGLGPRPIGFLEKIDGRNASSLADFSLCRSVLKEFYRATGCEHGDANCNNFIIKPDGLSAIIYDFEFANGREEDKWTWEIENLEKNLREDAERRQEIGEVTWRKECINEEIGDMVPMTDEEELRRHELGVDGWRAEKVRERLRDV